MAPRSDRPCLVSQCEQPRTKGRSRCCDHAREEDRERQRKRRGWINDGTGHFVKTNRDAGFDGYLVSLIPSIVIGLTDLEARLTVCERNTKSISQRGKQVRFQ